MSRVLVLVGFIVVGVLALLAIETAGRGAWPGSGPPAESQSSEFVTVRSNTSPGQASWLRLRWLLAGAAIASVALVGLRQYRLLARYQLGLYEPARAGRSNSRAEERPEVALPVAGLPVQTFSFDWIVERAPSSAGD